MNKLDKKCIYVAASSFFSSPTDIPEENLFCAIINQAFQDALSPKLVRKETHESAMFARNLKTVFYLINPIYSFNFFDSMKKSIKKFKKYKMVNNHDRTSARNWFFNASDEFKKICDYAGLDWKYVKDKVKNIVNLFDAQTI